MKKWMSLLLALVMALSLCSFAWADGEKATVVDDVLSATLAQEMAVLSAGLYVRRTGRVGGAGPSAM